MSRSFEGLLGGQIALVTGAGQGNGAAIARGLAKAGAHVVLSDRDAEMVETVAAEINAESGAASAVPFDVTDKAAVAVAAARVREEVGPIEVLVNNAGIMERVPVASEDLLDSAERVWRVNAHGPLIVTHAFLDQLRETRGRVVNLASITSFVSYPNVLGYASSKGALAQITRSLAVELAPDGIRVNALAPGVIATAMTQDTRDDPQRIGGFLTKTPMGRVGEPEELVGPVLFLASGMSSYVTGAILPVDGGFLCG